MLRAIADLPIPRLADASIIDWRGADGQLRRLGSSCQRAQLTSALDAIIAAPLGWDSPSPIVDVIRRTKPELISGIDDNWLETYEEPDVAPHWRALGVHSMLILPLTAAAGDESTGALTLLAVDPARQLTAESQAFAEKYAAAASLMLENARLYDVAQRANRARDGVLGVVSHDLRNPLSAIAMCARVLRHSAPAEQEARDDLLMTISESTDWMNRLIQDLLDVANIERGQLALELRAEGPAAIVEQAMHMFSVEAAEHDIALSANVELGLPMVRADSARVVQVLGNVLRNAIKFTPDGGRITLRTAGQDGYVVFSVTDTGSGITPDARGRVFDRYWQSSHGARTRGTGLGLSIAKGIVEAHHGRMWFDSTPGHGSTFSFTLPVAGAAAAHGSEE